MKSIISQDWYAQLVDECQAIMVEAEFTSRWAVVEGYWALGERICQEHDNFDRAKIYGKEITKRVATSLQKSPRTIQKAIQFYKKYPELDKLPEGKNTSWHSICNKYLTKPKKKDDDLECSHKWIKWCAKCGLKEPFTP